MAHFFFHSKFIRILKRAQGVCRSFRDFTTAERDSLKVNSNCPSLAFILILSALKIPKSHFLLIASINWDCV